MKVSTPLLFLLLVFACPLAAQTTESFSQLDAPLVGGTYGSGSFTGDDGLTWTYSTVLTQPEGITGQSADLRKLRGTMEVTLPNGISALSFDHLEVQDLTLSYVEVIFNAQDTILYETRGESGVVNISLENLTYAGATTLKIANVGNQSILLDNVTYTAYDTNDPPPARITDETFAKLDAPTDVLVEGTFIGDNNAAWDYAAARTVPEGITGQSIELRRLRGSLSTTIGEAFDSLQFKLRTEPGGGKTSATLRVIVGSDTLGEYQSVATEVVETFLVTGIAAPAGTLLRIESIGFGASWLDDVQWGGFPPTETVAVTGVTLNKPSTSIQVGRSEQLSATVTPADASNPSVSWSSSNPAIARVDESGTVTAVTEGSAEITVTTTDGGFTASCTVTVEPAPDTDALAESFINLNAPTGALGSGSYTGDNGAIWTYERAGTVTDGIDGPSIELRKLSGLLQTTIPVAFDSLQLRIRTVAGGLDRSAKVQVVVGSDTLGSVQTRAGGVVEELLLTDIDAPAGSLLTIDGIGFGNTVVDDIRWGNFPPFVPVTGVEVAPSSVTLTEGESIQITATVLPDNATEPGVTWTSADPRVATIDATGQLTAENFGSTFVVATTPEGGFTDTAFVTVEELVVPDDLPLDEQGWSVFAPGPDSRVIYCSDSEGDDTNDGLSPTAPVKTLNRAFGLVRDGEPDHVYLKRGDTWTDQTLARLGDKSGKNSFERMVIAYYGVGARPLIKINNQPILNDAIDAAAIIGIEFYNYTANPNDPDFQDPGYNGVVEGFRLVAQVMGDLLIEDCKVSYFANHLSTFNKAYAEANGSGDAYINLDLRRNIFVNAYQRGATDEKIKSQGIFISHTKDFLLEENFFDHNGWNPDLADAQPNQYNHNVYMSVDNEGPITVRGNVISRGAAHGVQLRSGGTAERNAFIGNAIGMNMGYSSFPTYYTGSTFVRENVVTDGRPQIPGDFSEPQTGALWGLWKQSINDLTVNDNIVANIGDPSGGNMRPYNGMTPNEFGTQNIAWNWTRDNVPATNPGWLDPTRNAASYALRNGYPDYDAWVAAASARGIREFPLQFSAYGYVNYIREGFNKEALDSLPFETVAVTSVELTLTTDSLAPNETLQLLATVLPENATDKTVSYTTSDEQLATVTATGLVTALTEGVVTITATTADGGFTDVVTITVTDAARIAPTRVTLSVGDTTVNVEDEFLVTATITPADATFQGISWVSSNPEVATVDQDGLVVATGAGTTAIVVTTDDEGLRDTALVTVVIPVVDLPIDPEGWTVATPSPDSRLIYCSDSEGNDANDGSQGSPVKSLNRAFSLLRDGFPDQLYLKRGDVWTNQTFAGLSNLSGRSATERIVITYYGTGARPQVATNNVRVMNAGVNHVAVIGVDFYNYTADPSNPAFSDPGKEGVAVGFRFVSVTAENVLFEDCKFSYYSDHFAFFNKALGRGDVFDNIEFRRNIFLNAYQRGSTDEKILAQGMFVSHTEDFLLEENFFDHNGWNEAFSDALPNQFNHNVYLSTDNAGPMIVRGNVISRAAAHGVQLRSGGVARNNAFIGNAIGMNMGFGNPPTYYTGETRVEHNVITDGRPQIPNDLSYPQSGAVWGLWKQSISNLTVANNIVANIEETTGGNMVPYKDMDPNAFGSGNIAWNWTRDNEPATDPGWRDPSRDKDSYVASLGYSDYDAWVAAAGNRALRSFPSEFSAQDYVAYIQQGFEQYLNVAGCSFQQEDFFDASHIVEVSPVTYADFTNRGGSYVVAIATGTRTDGRAGAWEIHNDCTVQPLRRTGRGNHTTLLPEIRGLDRRDGWRYLPVSISADGRFIYATAINEDGYVHPRGWTVEPGTTIDVRWELLEPRFGRVFGIDGSILCDDLLLGKSQGNFFVIACNDTEPMVGGTPQTSTLEAAEPATESLSYAIYPNPVGSGSVTIETGEGTRSIRLLGINGQVYRQLSQPATRTELNVSNLASGLYIIEITSADRQVREKLVVN